MTPEGKVVKQIRDYLDKQGYFTYNLIQVSPSSMPDMCVINPVNGEHTYLEIKAPGGRTQPGQLYMHEKLRMLNCKVYVVSDLSRVKEVFNDE